MYQHRINYRGRTDTLGGQGSSGARRESATDGGILLRNYDHQRAYDLTIEAVDPDDTVVFREQYYLQPGLTERLQHVLPYGTYEIRATLDNCHREVLTCQIDSSLEHTAVIEVGNGILSVTEGYYI